MDHAVLAPPGCGVRAELDRLLDTDPACADRDEIAELVSAASKLRAWLDGYEVRCARRTRATCRSRPIGTGHIDVRPQRATLRQGRRRRSPTATWCAINSTPSKTHWSTVRISAGHVDGVAAAIRDLDDVTRAEFVAAAPELLDAAVNESVDTFARHCRELSRHLVATKGGSDADELDRQRARSSVRRWVDKVTGMCHTHVELDPDPRRRTVQRNRCATGPPAACRRQRRHPLEPIEGQRVHRGGRQRCDPPNGRSRQQQCHCDCGRQGRRCRQRVAGAGDHDSDRLPHPRRTGCHEHSVCETEDGIVLPVSTVRRLCCDAEIIPVVLGTDGVPLDMGRSIRTANREPAPGLAHHVPHLCASRLHGGVLGVHRPPREVVVETHRPDRHRQPHPALRETPPPGARRRLDPHHDPGSGHHLDPTRRHRPLERHPPSTANRATAQNERLRGEPSPRATTAAAPSGDWAWLRCRNDH